MGEFETALRDTFGTEPFTGEDVYAKIPATVMPVQMRYAMVTSRRRGRLISIGKGLEKSGLVYRLGSKSRGRTLWMLYPAKR